MPNLEKKTSQSMYPPPPTQTKKNRFNSGQGLYAKSRFEFVGFLKISGKSGSYPFFLLPGSFLIGGFTATTNKKMKTKLLIIFWSFSVATLAFCGPFGLQYVGVNLSGPEFGDVIADGGATFPGANGVQYTYPTLAEITYFQSKGMNIIRLPFRWERLQRTNSVPLDPIELSNLTFFVSQATSRGMYVILDPHNYAR